jgi:RNA polymerase sigma-70 factor (ECF subfamily)
MDELSLIAAAQRGQLTAFNQLVREYQTLAYNVAYRILGDGEGASDACQEAFLSAYKNIRRLRGASFKSWLMRIVTNACYDQLRLRRRRPTDSLDDLLDDPESGGLLSDPTPTPETQMMSHELESTIMAGLQMLPDDQRVAVVLVDVQGFDYQEVADITHTSLGTVKSRLSRGRARLRDYLLGCGELLPDKYRPR